MDHRPTHKELNGKLSQASGLISNNAISLLDEEVILADAMALGYAITELPEILAELIDNTTPDHYAGSRPPQQSYERAIQGARLYAFRINSKYLDGKTIYYKFALYEDALILISLHEDR